MLITFLIIMVFNTLCPDSRAFWEYFQLKSFSKANKHLVSLSCGSFVQQDCRERSGAGGGGGRWPAALADH